MVEGSHKSLRGAAKERIADFVHGSDGFGNTNPPLAEVKLCCLAGRDALPAVVGASRYAECCSALCGLAGWLAGCIWHAASTLTTTDLTHIQASSPAGRPCPRLSC